MNTTSRYQVFSTVSEARKSFECLQKRKGRANLEKVREGDWHQVEGLADQEKEFGLLSECRKKLLKGQLLRGIGQFDEFVF